MRGRLVTASFNVVTYPHLVHISSNSACLLLTLYCLWVTSGPKQPRGNITIMYRYTEWEKQARNRLISLEKHCAKKHLRIIDSEQHACWFTQRNTTVDVAKKTNNVQCNDRYAAFKWIFDIGLHRSADAVRPKINTGPFMLSDWCWALCKHQQSNFSFHWL